MALGYLDDSKLYAIASAIRAKTGDSATMSVDDMPDEIGSISTGAQVEPLSVTENGTYTASAGHAYTPVTVNVSGGGGGYSIDDIAAGAISGTIGGSASSIGQYTFCQNRSITALSFPMCETIDRYAFWSCGAIREISFPNLKSAGIAAFASCSSLLDLSLPLAEIIDTGAFSACSNLSNVYLPNVSSCANQAFQYCNKLETVYMPNVSKIGTTAFQSCSTLTDVSVPKLESIAASAFERCRDLSVISLPNVKSIGSYAFRSCVHLVALDLTGVSSVPTIGSSLFFSTPLSNYSASAGQLGSIYIPSSMFNLFKANTSWRVYSSRFVSV